MTAREIFTESVLATEHLPEVLREHAGEVTGLEESVFDASYLEFLDEQIRLSPRGPEWSTLLSRRRAALLPFCGVPLLHGKVSLGDILFTVRVHPDTRSVIHWEEDQMADAADLT